MYGKMSHPEYSGISEFPCDVGIGDILGVDVKEGGVRVRKVLSRDDVHPELPVEEEQLGFVDLVI